MSKRNNKKPKPHPRPNYRKQQRAQDAAKPTVQVSGPRPAPGPAPSAARPAAPSPVVSLEPLAPVIVRSGRPFDFQAGADAARFPPPSTLAGCLRTAWARATNTPFGPELSRHPVAGPLLAHRDATGVLRPLAPKPADAYYFGHGDAARCVRAEPADFDPGCGADLPAGLRPLALSEPVVDKTSAGPQWWDLEDLIAFRTGPAPTFRHLKARGWSPPGGDRRTHVAIDPGTGAAEPSRLYQTEGLDLGPDDGGLERSDDSGLCLLARCAEPLSGGLVHLGGERRLARLRPEPEAVWPAVPDYWLEQIHRAGGLTLTLLTPAAFAAGYRPGWLDTALVGEAPIAPGVRLRLVAAAVERWMPHSGWDLAASQPRATRKLVAAGATYWLELLESPGPEALAPLWLGSLCDAEQDRLDGLGLALPVPWSPRP